MWVLLEMSKSRKKLHMLFCCCEHKLSLHSGRTNKCETLKGTTIFSAIQAILFAFIQIGKFLLLHSSYLRLKYYII